MRYLYNQNHNTLKKEIGDAKKRKKILYVNELVEYHQNVHIAKGNLHIQYNPNQSNYDVILKSRKNDAKIHMKTRDPKDIIFKNKGKAGVIAIPDFKMYPGRFESKQLDLGTKIDT